VPSPIRADQKDSPSAMRLLELQGSQGGIQRVAAYATINNIQPERS
jgi:hypothetical protein